MQNEIVDNLESNQQLFLLQMLIKKLMECQRELASQILTLKNVKVSDIVRDTLKELNKVQNSEIGSFEDLLVLNAKKALKGKIKTH